MRPVGNGTNDPEMVSSTFYHRASGQVGAKQANSVSIGVVSANCSNVNGGIAALSFDIPVLIVYRTRREIQDVPTVTKKKIEFGIK